MRVAAASLKEGRGRILINFSQRALGEREREKERERKGKTKLALISRRCETLLSLSLSRLELDKGRALFSLAFVHDAGAVSPPRELHAFE